MVRKRIINGIEYIMLPDGVVCINSDEKIIPIFLPLSESLPMKPYRKHDEYERKVQ